MGYGNQVDAGIFLDPNRLAQECPLRISGTLRNCPNAAHAFFRPESVEVVPDGIEFVVVSEIFAGAFNRLVLRTVHSDRTVEVLVSADKSFPCGTRVAAKVSADRITFFGHDGQKASE